MPVQGSTPAEAAISRRAALATGLGLAGTLAMPRLARGQATELRVSLNTIFDGSNAAFFLGEERGFFRDAGLRCQFDASGGSGEAVNRIGSGAYDVGIADINVLLEFNGRNPAAAGRCVYMLYYRSPLSVCSVDRAGIQRPADLAGKRIGTAQTDGAFRLFPVYARLTGIDASAVRFTFGNLQIREALLLRGEVDAILGFDSTMHFGLVRAGIRPETLRYLYYADVPGFPLYGNGVNVSGRLLQSNPDAVRRFVLAAARSWQAAVADPAAAIAALQRRERLTDVPLETEKLRWLIRNQLVTDESRQDGLGGVRADRLAASTRLVAEGFGIAAPGANELFDPAFLPPAEVRRLPT